jgi:hypothetical protein
MAAARRPQAPTNQAASNILVIVKFFIRYFAHGEGDG